MVRLLKFALSQWDQNDASKQGISSFKLCAWVHKFIQDEKTDRLGLGDVIGPFVDYAAQSTAFRVVAQTGDLSEMLTIDHIRETLRDLKMSPSKWAAPLCSVIEHRPTKRTRSRQKT